MSDEAEAIELIDRFLSAPMADRGRLRAEILASRPDLAPLLNCASDLDSLASPVTIELVSPLEVDRPVADGDHAADSKHVGGNPSAYAQASEDAGFEASALGQFDKYELVRELGRGGMGVVYEARQLDLGRTVAVKMILSSHLVDAAVVQRFRDEARTAARVRHANVVAVHEVGQWHGQHYFVMDYIAGPSLADVLRAGPMDFDTAATCLATVARAVDHLHACQIIHRDLKPSNILLDGAGRPFVTDFGLAKVLDADTRRTRTGMIVGTPSYMSPEQAAGKLSEISPRSDVYSLGAMLYEMLTGRPPFVGETHLDTLLDVLQNDPQSPRALNRRIPRDLEAICLKCLERDPRRRYASAVEMADDLERFLCREPVSAGVVSPWHRLRRWQRREPALAMRLAGLSAAAAIAQGRCATMAEPDLRFHVQVMSVIALWALAAIVLQRLSAWSRTSVAARWLWTPMDAAWLTWLLALADPPRGPLLAAYPLLVAASGLLFRTEIVIVTTATALASYGVLLWLRPEEASPPHYPAFFALATALVGAVVAYQVDRIRALSRPSSAELPASKRTDL